MKILNKHPDKDFIILNLTDPQLSDQEWEVGHTNRKILEHTVNELIEQINPDLITISGDLAWAGHDHAYDMLAKLIDGYNIPWAPVWGNHDNQNGPEYIDTIATKYMHFPNCIYEKGDPTLGNGNYVIGIEENGKSITALFMVDSHDREDLKKDDGTVEKVYSKLTKEQAAWLTDEAENLRASGYNDAAIILHIPIYAYRKASDAAYKISDLKSITLEQSMGNEPWNEGYEESVGVQHEAICSHPIEDGMLDVVKDIGIVKHIIAGHEHNNNFIILYDGVKMVYSLKTGAGCYWEPNLNGGTVLKINGSGIYDVHHEYVDTSDIQ